MFTKSVFLLLLNFAITGCHPPIQTVHDNQQETGENKYFSLIKATSVKWSSPLNDGRRGTEYYFTVRINTDEKTGFDSAWILNKSYPVFITKERSAVSNEPLVYGKGDTIILRISAQSSLTQPDVNPPFNYAGDALISYTINNGQRYFIVKKIITLATPVRQ